MKKIFFFTSLSFLFLACSKDKSMTDDRGSASAINANQNKTLPEKDTVHILNTGFVPTNLKIDVDNTVIWVNDDNKVHTVTSESFDSGDILPGGSFSHLFDNAGVFAYYCKYHEEKAEVVVIAKP